MWLLEYVEFTCVVSHCGLHYVSIGVLGLTLKVAGHNLFLISSFKDNQILGEKKYKQD